MKRKNFKATNSSRLCCKHFEAECFDSAKFGGTWLKKDAIPTIFNFPDQLQAPTKRRKPLKSRNLASETCKNITGIDFVF